MISDFDLTATISHFDERSTCIRLLDDYDEELAQKHMVNRWEPGSFTCDALRRRFEALRLQSQGETDGT